MQRKKLLFVIIVLFIITMLTAATFYVSASNTNSELSENYLVIGLDDAAENADTIMLLNLDYANAIITLLQIPRDTYYNYGYGHNKINGVFPRELAQGASTHEALCDFTQVLSRALGIKINGSVAISLSAFHEIIDKIGGVRITLDKEYVFVNDNNEAVFELSAGEHLLDSQTAEMFVRHRKGYLHGDLSRMEMQMLFATAFMKTCATTSPLKFLRVYESVKEQVVSTVPVGELFKKVMKYCGRIDNATLLNLIAPGESRYSQNGISYYALNRSAMDILLKKYFYSNGFDKEQKFLNSNDIIFQNIYFDNNFEFKIYASENT